jgi:hypothetical protein
MSVYTALLDANRSILTGIQVSAHRLLQAVEQDALTKEECAR